MNQTGKVAIVTGGTRGIGRAIAESLVSAGARVAITARNEHELSNTVSQLNRIGSGEAAGYVCDVRDYEQVKSVFANVGRDFGGVDSVDEETRRWLYYQHLFTGRHERTSRDVCLQCVEVCLEWFQRGADAGSQARRDQSELHHARISEH